MIDLPDLEARLREHVAYLAQTPRVPGTVGHRRALEYIRTHLEQAGFRVVEKRRHPGGMSCTNLLTEPLPGPMEGSLLVVGAHYDSVADSVGADDNARAVAALLEL